MKKTIVLVFIMMVINQFVIAQTDSMLTLKQCVDIALANNLLIHQNELLAQTNYINLKQARNNRIPFAGANINHGVNEGRSIDPFTNSYANQNISFANYNLSASINLFSGGQTNSNIKLNQYELDASKMDLQQVKENTTLNIILAYLQVLNSQDLAKQSKNQYTLTQKQVNRLEILNKEGAIIPAQLYELKGQLASDQVALVDNENALDAAMLSLCQLMNIPYKKFSVRPVDVSVEQDFSEAAPSSIFQTSVEQFPAVKAALLRRKSNEAAIKFARSFYYPSITLGGDVYTNFSSAASTQILQNTVQEPSGDYVEMNGSKLPVITNRPNFTSSKIGYFNQFRNNYSTSLSVNLRIPLLNYRQAKNKVLLAQEQFKNASFLEQSAKTQLAQNIEQAYFNASAALKKYTTLRQQVKDFNEAFAIAEVRFNEGATNQVEYLIAKNNLDKANINLIISRYNYILRTKILDYYKGKLTL